MDLSQLSDADLAALYQKAKTGPTLNAADEKDYPAATPWNNFRAGVGKAALDANTAAQQLLSYIPPGFPGGGMPGVPREFVDQIKKQDAPLLKTGAGLSGNIAGNVALTLPLALVPGINTLGGAAAAGALYGATEPVGTGDSRLANTAKGAALFSMAPALGAAYRGTKALIEPLYQSGREAITGRVLNRFAGQDPNAIDSLRNAEQFVPGSLPTAADATGNAAFAMLENGAGSKDPLVKEALARRMADNNSARVDALREIAGDESKLSFYKQSRAATADDLYNAAFKETPTDSAWIKGQITQLMQRPAFADALKQGQELALNQGVKVSPKNPENTTEILHYTKMALDDAIGAAEGNSQRALMDTRDKLVSLMESKGFSPSYRVARDTYAKMSAPINQMEVGQALYNKLQPALNDFGGTTRNKAASYAEALRNGDVTAQRATGFPGAKMESVMTPEQMQSLTGIAKDLSRRSATEDAMRGIGSNTSQNLAAQNVLGQMGVPETFGQKLLGNITSVPYVGGLLEFGARGAESAVQRELAAALLDPKKAAALMQRAKVTPGLLGEIQRYLAPARGGLLGVANGPQQ